MVKTASFKRLILRADLRQVSLIVVRGPPTFWRSPMLGANPPTLTQALPRLADLFDRAAPQPFFRAPKSPNLRNWLSQKPNSWSKPPRSWVWTLHGAHLLLQTRTRVLNQDLDDLFRRWYPKFRSQPQTQESERKAA